MPTAALFTITNRRAQPRLKTSEFPTNSHSPKQIPTNGSVRQIAKILPKEKNICKQRRISVCLQTSTALPKLAWFEYLSGNTEQAVNLLGTSAEHQKGQAKALSLYYRGAILNRSGRYAEALTSLDQSLAERPDLILASEEKGESLWRLGRKMEAVSAWRDAVKQNPKLPLANNFLAAAAASLGQPETAAAYEKVADKFTPADPFFHWMLGLRLQNAGMDTLAEKHFEQAIKFNPALKTRRN